MNKPYLAFFLMFICSIAFLSSSEVKAQEPFSASNDNTQTAAPARPNLLRELNLSNDQIRQIRRINQERKPSMQEAQRRLKEANDALDQAVYSDSDNDTEVQARIKEVHAAQLEVLRNRTITEQSIRRILNTEQLGRFRTLRQQYRETKAAGQPNIKNPNAPANLRLKRVGNQRLNRRLNRQLQ